VHTETGKQWVYALVVAKGGPKLKPPASTTVQLVERLARILGRPVLNQTGIQVNFDFPIDYPPGDAATDETRLRRGDRHRSRGEAVLELQFGMPYL
jgi:hypothetical protein